jgi:hypothetical protein
MTGGTTIARHATHGQIDGVWDRGDGREAQSNPQWLPVHRIDGAAKVACEGSTIR